MKRLGTCFVLALFGLLPVYRLGAQPLGANLQAKYVAGSSFVAAAQHDDGDDRDRDDHDRDRDRDRHDVRHELRIDRAVYGEGRRTVDVTDQVRAQIRDGRLNIPVSNQTMGGDPARNRPKTLTVWYRLDGHDAEVTVNENEYLELPGGEAQADRRDDGGDHDYDQARVERVVLHPGTELALRTDERIDSHEVVEGQTFRAEVAEDVRDDDGQIAIPRGSDARLVTRRLEGNGDITLDIQSIWVGGKRYRVSTEGTELENHRDGIGANQRTGEFVGGGAAIGAIIGAIAGGGRGAAIGAVAGAGAGAGTEIITQGREVHVPAESVLRFRLDHSLRLHLWQ
jgi:DnaJ-like protein